MYKPLIWCASAILAVGALTIAIVPSSEASSEAIVMPTQAKVAEVTPTEAIQPEADFESDRENIRFEDLSDYILGAMKSAAKPDQYSADYDDIAHDIASVVLDPAEPPIWKNDATRARSAIMLVSIAYWETRYRAYVDDGRCNDFDWRKTTEGQKIMLVSGECDGGHARSMWQVHADQGGIVIIPASYDDDSKDPDHREWSYINQRPKTDGTQVIPDQMRDRKSAIRVALHMARRSIRRHARLCQYTGEWGDCPKGEVRYNWAEGPRGYSTMHPFKPIS